MEFTVDEIRKKAISAMETCMAYCKNGSVYGSKGGA